nr:hypothetical protein [uncultured Blautia sp.]
MIIPENSTGTMGELEKSQGKGYNERKRRMIQEDYDEIRICT